MTKIYATPSPIFTSEEKVQFSTLLLVCIRQCGDNRNLTGQIAQEPAHPEQIVLTCASTVTKKEKVGRGGGGNCPHKIFLLAGATISRGSYFNSFFLAKSVCGYNCTVNHS
jgi:hypothetical protein